ncbi:hypothetical protein MPLSOD_50071 [Mesorhizobium sp. SOD10]|nr:hypothetical protein MPLSOD_50071 [Mesorhizobium sp. SOD10]
MGEGKGRRKARAQGAAPCEPACSFCRALATKPSSSSFHEFSMPPRCADLQLELAVPGERVYTIISRTRGGHVRSYHDRF